MDFTQYVDSSYIIPTSIVVGSTEPIDVRYICDTVEDFNTFLDDTDMDLRYEGLVTYEKINKRLMVYQGNNTWGAVSGASTGGNCNHLNLEVLEQITQTHIDSIDTHTEQITDLTKKLSKIEKLEASTVSTFVTESNFTVVEHTSNGYFEGVKLEGKTFANRLNVANIETMTSNTTIINNGIRYGSNTTQNLTPSNIATLPSNIFNSNKFTLIFTTGTCAKNTSMCLQFVKADSSVVNDVAFEVRPYTTHAYIVTPPSGQINEVRFRLLTGSDANWYEFKNIMVLEGDQTQKNISNYFEGVTSVGQDVEEINIRSTNNDVTQSDEKQLLFYNKETQSWEKPVLHQWDSIEKHSDGKYYYHKRSGKVVLNGTEGWNILKTNANHRIFTYRVPGALKKPDYSAITNRFVQVPNTSESLSIEGEFFLTDIAGGINISIANSKLLQINVDGFKQWLQANNVTVVYQLAEEEVYECTNIDLITYDGETNYIVNSGAISPKSSLKVHSNISNVVKILQEKVSLLESNVKASQEMQDMMILESDMRILELEMALMPMNIELNIGGNPMLRSATYYNFIKRHIESETYSKEYLENVMNKYLATNRLTEAEYDELYKILYPPVYDIELPIEL